MAGLGSRFKEAGYKCPKFMIEAKGKTMFEWSMDSLADYFSHTKKIVFVSKKEYGARGFIQEKIMKYPVKDYSILELNYTTDGQATTAYLGMKECCCDDDSVLIYNIDTYIEPFNLKYNDLHDAGHIPCFHADGDHWSFVKEDNGKVIEVVEKKRISDNCSLGVYYFSSINDFMRIYESFDFQSYNKEKYIAPMYNELLNQGKTVSYSIIDSEKVHVLGTPKELDEFINL